MSWNGLILTKNFHKIDLLIRERENKMAKETDKDLYIAYCNSEIQTIEELTKDKSNDDKIKLIVERIQEMERMRFEGRSRLSILHTELAKVSGPGKFFEMKQNRDTLIDGNFKMPEYVDPREKPVKVKKEAKPKADLLKDLGFDKESLLAAIRAKREANKK